jgi:glycosyltransferase involved in cell wall biosynthesis
VASSADRPVPVRWLAFARAVRAAARGADVWNAHFALYALPCLVVPSVRRLPLVVTFHGPWAEEFVANGSRPGWRVELKRWVERLVYRRAVAFVTLSEAFKQVLVDQFGVAADRVHVEWPGVDLDRFSPGDRAAARRALGLDEQAWVAVTVRRLVPRMGLDALLEAWASISGDGDVLLVVGDGEERAALEATAERLGCAASVRFLGPVGDEALTDAYRAADVSVVPSVALEGFGLVVLESLACGTPVIGTAVDGLREVLDRVDPDLVVAPGDVSALAARLVRAQDDGGLPSRADCRAFAAEHGWTAVAERQWLLFAEVARARQSR